MLAEGAQRAASKIENATTRVVQSWLLVEFRDVDMYHPDTCDLAADYIVYYFNAANGEVTDITILQGFWYHRA